MGMLLAGRGLSPDHQPAPAVPFQLHGLRPGPAAAAERMARLAPDLYFDVNSHVLDKQERHKLAQVAPELERHMQK
jgi:outer membrane protein OmpA-like peptidoglycan-associated protein